MKTTIIFLIVLLVSIAALCKSFYSFTPVPRETPLINFKNYYTYAVHD